MPECALKDEGGCFAPNNCQAACLADNEAMKHEWQACVDRLWVTIRDRENRLDSEDEEIRQTAFEELQR